MFTVFVGGLFFWMICLVMFGLLHLAILNVRVFFSRVFLFGVLFLCGFFVCFLWVFVGFSMFFGLLLASLGFLTAMFSRCLWQIRGVDVLAHHAGRQFVGTGGFYCGAGIYDSSLSR